MKIHVSKPTATILGALRLSEHVMERLEKIAEREGVSKQEVVRAILDQVIDSVE